MRAVNLLPRDEVKQARKRPAAPLIVGVLSALVVVAALAGGYMVESAKVARKQTDLDAARAELALVPPPAQPSTESSALASEQMSRTAALQQALNGRVAWDRLLREISLVLPRDVWLSSLQLQVPVAPTAAVPPVDSTTAPPVPATTSTTFTMNGNAYSHEGVARLLSRLALVPDLDNVTLGNSTRIAVGKRSAVQFSITAGIRLPGGGS
jgi:Tfp pilus assembly protein PilN